MIKILYLIPRFTGGGAEHLVLEYAKYFSKKGFQVAVASVVGGGELENEFKKSGVQVFSSRNKSLLEWRKLKKFIKDFSPDIIHSNVFSADVAGFLLRKNLVWISTQHNVEQEYSWLRKIILKIILTKANQIIAVGQVVKDFCLQNLKLDNVILIKNGVMLSAWLKISVKNLLVQKQIQIATIGRLERQKGHKYLIQALADLKDEDWKLHVYGDGTLKNYLKDLVFKLGLSNRLIWHGFCPNLKNELDKIDVVVQPSLWEGLSLVVMEAMSAGRLIITTPVGGEELVQDKITGLIVPEKNPQALGGILKEIFNNRKKYREFGLVAREYAKNNFSMEKHFCDLKNLYDSMV